MQGHSFESLETLVDSQTNLFWFRRDLRLEDNAGLYDALQAGNVLCIHDQSGCVFRAGIQQSESQYRFLFIRSV
jgi:deoxyribodipyrimidine photolyase